MSIKFDEVRVRSIRSALPAVIVILLVGNAVALAAHEPEAGDGLPVASEQPAVSLPVGDNPLAPPTTTAPAPTTPTTAAKGAPKREATTTTTSSLSSLLPPAGASGEYTYEATVAPLCVTPGQEMTATLRLKKGDGGIIMPAYSDGSSQDQWHTGWAGDDGLIVYTWPVPPVFGDGVVLTQAHDPATKKKGAVSVRFRVVEKASSC